MRIRQQYQKGGRKDPKKKNRARDLFVISYDEGVGSGFYTDNE